MTRDSNTPGSAKGEDTQPERGEYPSFVQQAMELFDASIVERVADEEFKQVADEEFLDRHEFYWAQLDEHERGRLLRPNKSMYRCYHCGAMPSGDPDGNDQHRPDCPQLLNGKEPRCYFCGRITRHSRDCWELHRCREIKMPFGKYKGRSLGEVPLTYLGWLHRNATLPNDLRMAIQSVLEETNR